MTISAPERFDREIAKLSALSDISFPSSGTKILEYERGMLDLEIE
jgi:hypothetical protein